jgi:hypothetical protein
VGVGHVCRACLGVFGSSSRSPRLLAQLLLLLLLFSAQHQFQQQLQQQLHQRAAESSAAVACVAASVAASLRSAADDITWIRWLRLVDEISAKRELLFLATM